MSVTERIFIRCVQTKEEDNSFYDSLDSIAACLTRYDRKLKSGVYSALTMAKGNVTSAELVKELIDNYGVKVVAKFKKYDDTILS